MLSQESKHKVLFYLCYSGKTIISGSTHYNSIVDSRLNGLNSFIEDQVIKLLDELDSTRDRLTQSMDKSNVIRVGDIELDSNKSISLINGEYKRLKNELSSLLDIPNSCKSGSTVRIAGP
jgi:hypothetical protein